MSMRATKLLALMYLAALPLWAIPAAAESYVEENSNIIGRTPPGYFRGIPAMQDNEGSCAINPILPRNIVCAWNASGGSDDAIGDTWLRFSESLDGGRRFFNRYLNGSNLDPATSVGAQFAADPVMMCWPGGCGTIMLAANRDPDLGGTDGGIFMQWMFDLNTESGFRKAMKTTLDQVYRSTGSHFADKPHAIYILDEDNPGTIPVSFEAEMPDGSVQTITREWPRARIIVVFALFNPSRNDIEILSTYTDNYGGNWSNVRQVAQTSGRDQGVSLAAIGDTVFYGFRRFANLGETDDFMGVVSNNRGERFSKPFVVVEDVCVYDVPTLPATDDSTAAAARTNDFPWVSQDGSRFIMVYSERRRSSDGGCLTDTSQPSDSRILAVVGGANGMNWGAPTEVDPNPDHGFQFMPVVECSLGICQVAWWDSRRDSLRTREFLEAQANPAALAALNAFENLPILADFHFPFGIEPAPNLGYQFRRTADMYTRKLQIQGNSIVPLGDSTRASRYRLGLYPDGEGGVRLVERENNPFNVKAYRSNTVPFMSDYSSLVSVRHRYVFDPTNLAAPPYWESNAGPKAANLPDPNEEPVFWLAWTDARNMRGAIYTYRIDGTPPYARTPEPQTAASTDDDAEPDSAAITRDDTLTAEPVEDLNPAAGICQPVPPQQAGSLFIALHNRVKDSDIYGAFIQNQTTAWSLNPTKTLGLIQRTYVIVVDNDGEDGMIVRLEIANQPVGAPDSARASWRQLPFDPSEFLTVAPTTGTFEAVGPRSSASVALFVVSDESVNPVVINIYDVTDDVSGVGTLIESVTVNGAIEAGPLLNADGTPNNFEEHNPFVYAPDYTNPDHYNPGHYTFDAANPDQFNPDQYNPDQFNPDLFNPDLFNPDQFNPDQFNPDQFNPDQYNPDQYNPDLFNPDQFNPDQFNPDQFNPDQFNPDQFNVNLTDSDDLQNNEIPDPDLANVERDADANGNYTLVSKVDVNFGLQNIGNTLTPYTVDFAISDAEVLELIESGAIATQLIAWQNKQIDDVQYCTPRLVTENRVISAENNPDLSQLTIPTILDNRAGALTYFVAPDDIVQNTLRFIGPIELIRFVELRLRDDIISYVFTAQTANTGETELRDLREQIINDRTPASFNIAGGAQTIEANTAGGAYLPADFVTATKDGQPVDVSCTPTLPVVIPLDALNGGAPTPLSCSATTPNGVTATLDLSISVVDTEAPIIDPTTLPGDLVIEADTADGSIVTYTYPTATDVWGVDPDPLVACTPASGALFPFQSPGPVTTVSCTATDASGNESDPAGPPPTTFTVTLEDTSFPVLDGFDPLTFVPPDADRYVAPDSLVYPLLWGPFTVLDADPNLFVDCEPGDPVGSFTRPEYAFEYAFPIGTTQVVCSATDSQNRTTTRTFEVTVMDQTAPVITLLGDSPYTVPRGPGPYDQNVDPGATALDNGITDLTGNIVAVYSDVDTTTPGAYTVTYSVTDASGNTGTATRTVIVADGAAPVITLLGDSPYTIQRGPGPYVDPGATALDDGITDLTSLVVADISNVDIAAVGTYTVYYSVTDASGNTGTATRSVTVEDNAAPVITLLGVSPYTIQRGPGPYDDNVDPGATALDDGVSDLSANIVAVYSNVDTTTVGTYTVTYSVTDASGNTGTAARTVAVVDNVPPVITLLGDSPQTVSMSSDPYADPGATALDDGITDLTTAIVVDASAVDMTTPGTYTVYYSVTDASGNTGTAERTVVVEFAYGLTQIIATKYVVKVGSSNPLYWAWLGPDGNPADSSADAQLLTIRDCETGIILINPVGDPGASGFRYKVDNWWQYNWDSMGEAGTRYCATVESGRTGQTQNSDPIRLN